MKFPWYKTAFGFLWWPWLAEYNAYAQERSKRQVAAKRLQAQQYK